MEKPAAHPDELMRRAFALHEAGSLAQARALYEEILRIDPRYADAHYLLARLEQDQGRDREALPHLRDAVAANDREPHFHRALGEALFALGAWDDAAAAFRAVVQLDPANHECWTNLALCCERAGRRDEAALHHAQARHVQESSPRALNDIALGLKERGLAEEALVAFRKALAAAPDWDVLQSNYLYTLNFSTRVTPAEVAEAHREFDRHFGTGRFGAAAPRVRDPDPERRLRIGYFSPDLRSHPVAVFLEPVLRHHDRARVEVLCYQLAAYGDEVSERLRALADDWVECRGLDDTQLAARLADDGVDIVVDLAGHTAGNRLAALGRKPAPVIATWLGYPNTTGLRTVDWRITDAECDPPGVESLHTEGVHRLPGAQWCFARPDVEAAVTPLPARAGGAVRFGSFNHASKLNDEVYALWARLLRRVERAQLLVWGVGAEHAARIRAALARAGIDPARVEFSERTALPQQLAQYQRTDIALDTFPYSGVTTTCNALWMGVPVLTLAGRVSAARSTHSILTALGLRDWSAATPDALVDAAARHAADLDGLARLRAGLRERLQRSALMDGPAFARKLEAAYREMWRARCRAAGAGAALSA